MSAVETILGCSPRVRMAPVLLLLATFATISQSSSDRYTAERDPIKQSAVNNLALQSPNVTTVGKSGPMRTDSTGSGPGAKTRDLKDCKDDVIGCQNEPISFERSSSEGSVPLSKHNQSNDSAEKCSSTPCTNTSLSSVHKLLFTPENRLQVYRMNGTRENVFNRPGAINRTNTDTFHVKTPNEHTAGFSDSILSHSQNLDKGEKDENAAADKNTIYMTNGKVGNTSELNTSSRDLQNNAGEAILGESKLAAPFQTNTTRKRENSLVNVGNVTAGAFNNCIEEADPNETNPKSCFRTGVNPVVRDYDETGRESTRRTFDNATDGNPHINPLNGWTATTEATIRLESTLINVPPTTNSAVLSGNGKGKKNELPTDIAAKKQVSGKAEKHRTKGARNGALLSALILSGLEMKPSAIKRSRLSVDNQSIRSRGGVLNEASSGEELPRKSGDKQENNTPDQQVSDEGVRLKGTNVQYTNSTPTTETGGRFETNSGLTLRPFGDRASEKAEKLSDDNLKQTEINLNFTGDNSKNLSAATEVGVIYGTGTDRATSSRPQQNGTSDIPGDDLDPFRSYGVVKYANGTKASGSLADLKTALDGKFSTPLVSLTTESDSDVIDSYTDLIAATVVTVIDDNETVSSANASVKPMLPWPVKKEAVVEGDLVLGGLMMVHEREDTITCGPVMPQGGIQALEAMLYTLDRLNEPPNPLLPNITLGAHILDDCDKDTYGLEMAVDFIKGQSYTFSLFTIIDAG